MTDILIIDDEEPIRALIRECLAGPTIRLREAADGGEGWAMLQAQRPDLVLLDMVMPGLSGLELLQHIRRDPCLRDLPVLVLSARASNDDQARGEIAGATGYVTKPFSPQHLLAVITPYLVATPVDPR